MRVDILMNAQAGYANRTEIESRVKRVLFRCDLRFHFPASVSEMQSLIEVASEEGTEFFIVCGGDGTLNATLPPIMRRRNEKKKTPPLCLVPVGTANDLANDLGIPLKIEKAARAVLEGEIRHVDVLEIKSGQLTRHMLTNGGLGIPAETAKSANLMRTWIKKNAADISKPRPFKSILKLGEKFVTSVGPKIYEILLIRDLTTWQSKHWEISVEIPGQAPLVTNAPMILVNNQPGVGGGFIPAPLTANDDGSFNLFLFQPTRLPKQLHTLLGIKRGLISERNCPSFETKSVRLRALDHSKSLLFFGDGEILHEDVREIDIRCIHPGIPIVTYDA